jgi:hypothetical protein
MIARLASAPPGDASAASFARDPIGSHIWQLLLSRASASEAAALVRVLAPATAALASSTHGSYVVRACLAFAPTGAARTPVIEALLPCAARLAADTAGGAHVVQAALVHASSAERRALVGALLAAERGRAGGASEGGDDVCAAAGASPTGAADEGQGSALRALASGAAGSLLAQRVLELSDGAQRADAQRSLLGCALELARSAPGSFVVATAVRLAEPAQRAAWLSALLPHAAELSTSKAGLRALHACVDVCAAADETVAAASGQLARAEVEAALVAFAAGDGAMLTFGARRLDAHGRLRAHEVAARLGLHSESLGEGDGRRLVVRRAADAAAEALLRRMLSAST